MSEQDKTTSRRGVLRAGMTAAAAGFAGIVAMQSASAQDKLAQDAVQYQKMPKDGAMCSTCVNFIAPNACQIVAGNIDPNGWCIAYGPKSG